MDLVTYSSIVLIVAVLIAVYLKKWDTVAYLSIPSAIAVIALVFRFLGGG